MTIESLLSATQNLTERAEEKGNIQIPNSDVQDANEMRLKNNANLIHVVSSCPVPSCLSGKGL